MTGRARRRGLVLARVEKEGAFASAALEAELERAVQLDARDRALATELVYGSLRVLPWLLDEHRALRAAGDRLGSTRGCGRTSWWRPTSSSSRACRRSPR